MDFRRHLMILSLLTLAIMVRAQDVENRKRILLPDSAKNASPHADQKSENDFEEWLRNEPIRPELHDSTAISPVVPSTMRADPSKLKPKQPPVSTIVIGWKNSAKPNKAEP